MRFTKASLGLILPLCVVWACGSSTSSIGDADGAGASTGAAAGSLGLGGDGPGAGGDGTSAASGSSTDPSLGGSSSATGGTTNTFGGNTPVGDTQCSDGKDNDGDGLIDGLDPECTGPWDNDEGSFATGIPGDNKDPKWQDCFFDGNSGAGDDGCRYATACLTGDLPADDQDCQLTKACVKFCAPLTPNGCDCFGCCTVQLENGDTVDVVETSTCSIDNIGDAKACPRCEKSTSCENACGRCELCAGKTAADLPADCTPPTGTGGSGSGGSGTGGTGSGGYGTGGTGGGGQPAYTCDGGEQVCGDGLPSCGIDHYCSLGCCIARPPR